MRTSIIKRAAALGAAALVGATVLVSAPAAQAADGTTSLATVLKAGQAKFDRDFKDYDIVTKAVEAVLAAKPDSAVKVLADGKTALTAFIPNDQAFLNLASAAVRQDGHDRGRRVQGSRGSGHRHRRDGPALPRRPGRHDHCPATPSRPTARSSRPPSTARSSGSKVTDEPSIILGDYAPKLANPRVILSQVDINKGNKQVAHGINAVLLPIAAG